MTPPRTIESFLYRMGKLPSLPKVFHELSREVDNPNASLEAIGMIIRRDPALVTRLLRLANSAIYGLPYRIETIEEALHFIGMRAMRELALSTVVINLFKGIPRELADVQLFWRHCLACASSAALLAQLRREAVPERYFVAGLVHDLGRLIMFVAAPQESTEILRRCRAETALASDIEREMLGFDHADLGAALLENWNMPVALIEMVRCHHRPLRTHALPADAALIHSADFLAHALSWGDACEYMVPPLADGAWNRCGLETNRLESFVLQVESRTKDLCSILVPSAAQA